MDLIATELFPAPIPFPTSDVLMTLATTPTACTSSGKTMPLYPNAAYPSMTDATIVTE
jgi:hypothetical protein